VKDTQTGAITRASTGSSGSQANGNSYDPSLSADGRFVAFWSDAPNLLGTDTNGFTDVFVKDLQTDAITRYSTGGSGAQGNGNSSDPSMSADGRYVAFVSAASNLVPGDTNGVADVFIKDVQTGAIIRVSDGSAGAQSDGNSSKPALSGDGRFLG